MNPKPLALKTTKNIKYIPAPNQIKIKLHTKNSNCLNSYYPIHSTQLSIKKITKNAKRQERLV
jgi:hypothetical protein